MTQYHLTESGKEIASGSHLDCWKALVERYGHITIGSLSLAEVVINPIEKESVK